AAARQENGQVNWPERDRRRHAEESLRRPALRTTHIQGDCDADADEHIEKKGWSDEVHCAAPLPLFLQAGERAGRCPRPGGRIMSRWARQDAPPGTPTSGKSTPATRPYTPPPTTASAVAGSTRGGNGARAAGSRPCP